MDAYHVVLVKFPIALWIVASFAIMFRAAFDGPLARAIDRALPTLLWAGVALGAIAWVVGLLVWPWEALSSTPLGRNHMLVSTWSLAYYTLLAFVRTLHGEKIWDGWILRLIMAGVAALGLALVGVAGTLGGHLAGVYTEVANVLRLLGWEVYTTYYVPNLTLLILLAASVLMILAGWMKKRARP